MIMTATKCTTPSPLRARKKGQRRVFISFVFVVVALAHNAPVLSVVVVVFTVLSFLGSINATCSMTMLFSFNQGNERLGTRVTFSPPLQQLTVSRIILPARRGVVAPIAYCDSRCVSMHWPWSSWWPQFPTRYYVHGALQSIQLPIQSSERARCGSNDVDPSAAVRC
jgi:hypothetical protein